LETISITVAPKREKGQCISKNLERSRAARHSKRHHSQHPTAFSGEAKTRKKRQKTKRKIRKENLRATDEMKETPDSGEYTRKNAEVLSDKSYLTKSVEWGGCRGTPSADWVANPAGSTSQTQRKI